MSRREYSGITEQRKAALKRLSDAEFLLDRKPKDQNWPKRMGEHARGAMYLAGYAIECKLKAITMEVERCHTLAQLQSKWKASDAEVYAHGLEALARRLPLYSNFQRSSVWRDFIGSVNRWRPAWRYDPKDYNNGFASEFMDAVKRVYNWLESNRC